MTEPFRFPSSWRFLDRPPLQLQTGLAGHVVVVLYWRLGCIHSRAALHELALVAADLAGKPVAVVAVHVPTCAAERDEQRLRRVVQQVPFALTVAIASERGDLERLPTMLLLDAQATVRLRSVGVPRRHRFPDAIEALRIEARNSGSEVVVPLFPAAPPASAALVLTAIAVIGDRIWIASAGMRRVLAFDLEGNLKLVVGSGAAGADDGAAELASFSLPVALCLHEHHLVVADAQSHTLRAIDRHSGDVVTWCGTGVLGSDDMGGSYGRDQALSSPCGVVSRDGGLYVCQAGTDQLWQIDPMTGSAMAWLGGGVTDHAHGYDDSLSASPADTFGEPCGLAVAGDELWLVAARDGTLSVVDLAHVQSRTVASGLRHPVACVVYGDHVLVADAWAGAVVAVSIADGATTILFGREHGLLEPVALCVHSDRLYILDVGLDGVFVSDLSHDDLQLARLPLTGLPTLAGDIGSLARMAPTAVLLQRCELREHSDVSLRIAMPGLADGTSVEWHCVDEAGPVLAAARHEVTEVQDGAVTLLLPMADGGDAALRIRVLLGKTSTTYLLPVLVSPDGSLSASLSAVLPTALSTALPTSLSEPG